MKHFLLLFHCTLFLLAGFSCSTKESRSSEGSNSIRIVIQPFSDLPENYLSFVSTELKKIYPAVEIKKAIPLPASAFIASRNRYRADTLIRILASTTGKDEVTIGLTTKDISTTKGKIADWGVMGLGYCPGHACVGSSFRLNKDKKAAQLFKVAVHELGHTQGLQHCPVSTCYMRDAEGKNHKDEEKEFCEKCRSVLLEKGWNLQQ